MTKIKNGYAYTEPGDKMFEDGNDTEVVKKIDGFVHDVLNKNFQSYVLVCKNDDEPKFHETKGGDMLSGTIIMKLDDQTERMKKLRAKRTVDSKNQYNDKKGILAELIMQMITAVSDDDKDEEVFADALSKTIRLSHNPSGNEKVYLEELVTDKAMEELREEFMKFPVDLRLGLIGDCINTAREFADYANGKASKDEVLKKLFKDKRD